MQHARIGWTSSAVVHVGLAIAGLAIAAPEVAPHFHFQRGAIELQGSFAAQAIAQATLVPSESEAEESPAEAVPFELASPAEMIPAERVAAQAPSAEKSPPADTKAQCDCPAHEQRLNTPKRSEATPAKLAELTPATETPPLPRAPSVAQLSTSAAASLPASSEPAGAEYEEPPSAVPTNRPPPYPADAYQRKQQGRILLEVRINPQGAVDSLRILESSSVESLDQSALDTVRLWRFAPARRAGQAVAATVNIPVRFAIRTS